MLRRGISGEKSVGATSGPSLKLSGRGLGAEKALRSEAGMVARLKGEAERSEERERLYLAGIKSRLSKHPARAFLLFGLNFFRVTVSNKHRRALLE